MTPSTESLFSLGDRVEITHRQHPWFGRTGYIVEPFPGSLLRWVVELDGEDGNYPGQRVGVLENEISRRPPWMPPGSLVRNRYSVGAEFWVTAEDEDEARTLVGNFVDSFPEQVSGHDGDALMQDVSLIEAGVDEDDA